MGAIQSRDLSLVGEYRPISDHDLCAIAKLRSWKGNVVEHLLLVPFAPSCEGADPLLSLLYNFVLSDPFYPCFDVSCTQPAGDRFPNLQTFHEHLRTMYKNESTAATSPPGIEVTKRVARSWVLLRLQDNQIDPNATNVKYGFVKSLINVPGCKLSVAGYYHSLSAVTLPSNPSVSSTNKVDINFCLARNFCNEARSAAMFHLVSFFERASSKHYGYAGGGGSGGAAGSQSNHLPTCVTFCFRKGNLPALRLFAKLFQWHLTSGGQATATVGLDFTIAPLPESSDCLVLTLCDNVLNQLMRKVQFVARKSANGAVTMPSFIQAPHTQMVAQQQMQSGSPPGSPASPIAGKRGSNKQHQNVDQVAGSVSTPFDAMIQAEKNTWCAEEENETAGKKSGQSKSGSATPMGDSGNTMYDSYGMMMPPGIGGADSSGHVPQAFGMGCPSDDGFSAFASSGTIASGVTYGGNMSGPHMSTGYGSHSGHRSGTRSGGRSGSQIPPAHVVAGANNSGANNSGGNNSSTLMSSEAYLDGLPATSPPGLDPRLGHDPEVSSNGGDPPTPPNYNEHHSRGASQNPSMKNSRSSSIHPLSSSRQQSPVNNNSSLMRNATQPNNQVGYPATNIQPYGQQQTHQPHQQHNGQQYPHHGSTPFPQNALIIPDATPVHASSPNGSWVPCWWSDANSGNPNTQIYTQRCSYQPHLNDGKVLLEMSPDSLRQRHRQDGALPLVDAQGNNVHIPVVFQAAGQGAQNHVPVVALPVGTLVQGPQGMYAL